MYNYDTKILIVDEGEYEMYGNAFYGALLSLGYKNTTIFRWSEFFLYGESVVASLVNKAESKFACGILTSRMNNSLKKIVRRLEPDIVFIYSGRQIYESTVIYIRKICKWLAIYCNDNPFSDYYPKYFWRHYRESIKHADITYVYRESNIEDVKKYGAKNVRLLRSYYNEKRNFYTGEDKKINLPQIGFIGHFENDGRDIYIKALMDNGIRVALTGAWPEEITSHENCTVVMDYMENYNQLLNDLDIAIVFLSKLNHDTYTRRCFEIPVTKTMMLSEYTEDIASMYIEDKEIVFFKTVDEFVAKARYYLEHGEERKQIGESGYERLLKDGHEAKDRVKQIMRDYSKLE